MNAIKKILFIRRDNIGDLVCTTPAIRAVRLKFPEARIAVLANTYNAEMVYGNPDVDEVFVYEKTKHANRGRLGVWLGNFRLMRRIKAQKFDVAIGCGSASERLARYTSYTGARRRIGYSEAGDKDRYYNSGVPEPAGEIHEVEKVFALLKVLGIEGEPGPMVLGPDPEEVKNFKAFREKRQPESGRPLLAVAISTRIEVDRWPEEKFTELIDRILDKKLADVLLLWAPGDSANPFFPGEDEVAARIKERFEGRLLAYPTLTLSGLVAALSASDAVLSLNTGSLHIAAALQRPTVALMPGKKAPHWRPWKVLNTVLTTETAVGAIPVEAVLDALASLIAKLPERSDTRSNT